jgi:hypothetical protein
MKYELLHLHIPNTENDSVGSDEKADGKIRATKAWNK